MVYFSSQPFPLVRLPISNWLLLLLGWCVLHPISVEGQVVVELGNAQTQLYLPQLLGKEVAVVGNHTSVVGSAKGGVHLVDTLLASGVEVVHVFAPEHGFRGEAANGAVIQDGIDVATGLKVFSLHGRHKKPTPQQLEGIDVVVLDIQDVGARFYTYVSSMVMVMEACAEQGVKLMVLDRPNPHGHHMQGPMLEPEFKSFVGFIPTPMVHGLTLGELAKMAVDESWVDVPMGWDVEVIPCVGWHHGMAYELGIRPSPNLPTSKSIALYPSLCLFEPTVVSVGRGTPAPFERLGHPERGDGDEQFLPLPVQGAAPHPKHEGRICNGPSLGPLLDGWKGAHAQNVPGFSLAPLWEWSVWWRDQNEGKLEGFFTSASFFDKLAGTEDIRKALEGNIPLSSLEERWQEQHRVFFDRAEPHLLYPWRAPVPGR